MAHIINGAAMRDTEGRIINAHGGGLLFESGTFYWFGENKEFTDGKNGIWTWGIKCYSSKDLCTWTDMGLIIPPDEADRSASLHPSKCVDRPHIIRDKKTGKYVCWIKISGKDAYYTVLSADNILGPYTVGGQL